ncbi:predicted protein [Chaetoceros tenuissimus]|uniref:Uncharacterized protein n=1 Tax=Chaetoceros tenuissimus TaxID=426638 RepID=A0AAD3CVK0_9STRA|nr:predicted protein [Chaetoceros tenuissimus]
MSGSKRPFNDQEVTSFPTKKQICQNGDYEIHFMSKDGRDGVLVETIYKTKGSTKFITLATKYSEEVKGKCRAYYRFLLDDQAILNQEDTVHEIFQGYSDEDNIEYVYVVPEQLGC